MRAKYRLRQVVNIVNLSTPLGLLLARAGGHGVVRRGPDGLLLADGYRLPLPVAPAFTLGNVIVFRDLRLLEGRPRLLAHEGRHATQYSWCLGVVMLLPYLACVMASFALCGDWASYNPFERLAGLEDGGYRKRRLRGARFRGAR
ncbi:hypothetical protein EDD29_6249 [Actinocorallia herbida]|uniref:DUF4157 domain-containing protein n=1 Tax=Actinocorallia herbida TaxID=58109 RepID=A0A3N1D658_9ACTN|nr:hypothetical protein [Actinocorallia herbida]ROO88578.1 hypothetical protein EDD29_6249 [Actinocorallia herbida]